MSSGKKTVLVMAGGTGGHVFPALSVAGELIKKRYDIQWLGTQAGIEADLVPSAGYLLHTIKVNGLRGKGKLALLKAPFLLIKAVWQAYRVIRRIRPVAVIGFGGFATGPGGVAAKLCSVPLVIHEQNARPGMTNRMLAPLSSVVIEAFPDSFVSLSKNKRLETLGNPVRPEIAEMANAVVVADASSSGLNVLVVGGSLGAVALTEAVAEAMSLMKDNERPSLLHQVGRKNTEAAHCKYTELDVLFGDADSNEKIRVVPFIADMAEAYRNADLVVCRAGASTVSEIACVGIPAIFVPLPHAVDDHQTANARVLESVDAAEILPQRELNGSALAKRFKEYMTNKERLARMAENAKKRAIPESARLVAEQVEEQIRVRAQ